MVRKSLAWLVPALLVVVALGGLSVPARAALVDSPCLAYLSAGFPPPHAAPQAPSGACAGGTSAGSATGPPPSGEYLDLVTGIVYQDTGAGLQPMGVGNAQQGYVELTTMAPSRTGPGEDQCDSTLMAACQGREVYAAEQCEPLVGAVLQRPLDPLNDAYPCEQELASINGCPSFGVVCQHVHVADAHCDEVDVNWTLTILHTGATFPDYLDSGSRVYPAPACVSSLSPTLGGAGPTTVDNDYTLDFSNQCDPQADGVYTVVSNFFVGGVRQGSTTVYTC